MAIYTDSNQTFFDVQGQSGNGAFIVDVLTAQSHSARLFIVAPDPAWTIVPGANTLSDIAFDSNGIAIVDGEQPPAE